MSMFVKTETKEVKTIQNVVDGKTNNYADIFSSKEGCPQYSTCCWCSV
jgi:hypothetical protein